ncbi:glycosyl hydrolase family 28-related protein [Bradyrhizobium guangzhouense]|uniref:glycosyl hydrolase family 28-related protein n=1 Tax=Bradyrhizobium guangzhouense TaxID=1325095 RepID=UPI001009D27E|nr:glycosyl hydrolase family 28-related protein [Bradyrhizobium guangzhouense]RXH06469.1 hypothetical protein EAS54_38590 [Bradyrhizobium guangzhouense]
MVHGFLVEAIMVCIKMSLTRSAAVLLAIATAIPSAKSEDVHDCGTGLGLACTSADRSSPSGPGSSGTIDVSDFGAKCDGSHDDTISIRAAAAAVPPSGAVLKFPKGVCTTHATIYVKAHTHIKGDDSTLLAIRPWSADRKGAYALLENLHYDAGEITDQDISVDKITFDYGDVASLVTPGGGKHAVRFVFVRDVSVTNNIFYLRGAEDAVAGLGVNNMLVQGNAAYEFRNCAYDFWFGPSHVRLVDNYAATSKSDQMVNFNPERTSGAGDSTGEIARGFTMSNNTLVATGPKAVPVQIEPLGPGTAVRDVSVAGNELHNSYLVLRGNVREASVTGNRIISVSGGVPAFLTYPRYGEVAISITFSNNWILDPQTRDKELGVIRMEAQNATITGNTIIGSQFQSPGVYVGKYSGIVGAKNPRK